MPIAFVRSAPRGKTFPMTASVALLDAYSDGVNAYIDQNPLPSGSFVQ